ncbi:MAG: RNA polymerase sigma factor [Flavobacteriales bacterium]|nr:RNA polymerase sigma factor [Flavobacteriales bacterium]
MTEFNHQLVVHQRSLEYFARSLTRDLNDARDLLQDTLVKALTYKQKYREDRNFKSWLFTIMRNTFLNNYRRTVLRNDFQNEAERMAASHLQGDVSSAESIVVMGEIQRSLNKLPENLRDVFDLFVKGYKYREIAEAFDQPIGTIKSKIFQARKILMQELEESKR